MESLPRAHIPDVQLSRVLTWSTLTLPGHPCPPQLSLPHRWTWSARSPLTAWGWIDSTGDFTGWMERWLSGLDPGQCPPPGLITHTGTAHNNYYLTIFIKPPGIGIIRPDGFLAPRVGWHLMPAVCNANRKQAGHTRVLCGAQSG